MTDLNDLVAQVRPDLRQMLAEMRNAAIRARAAELQATLQRGHVKNLMYKLRSQGVPLKVLGQAGGVSFQRAAQLTRGLGNHGYRGRRFQGY